MRLLLALLLLALPAAAADIPYAPRLAAGPAPRMVGGVQLQPGGEGTFQLFTFDAETGEAGTFGKYNGQLAGIALDAAGMPLILTRDGALNRLGDDAATLALPDSRWNMQALAYWRKDPVGLHVEDNLFHTTTPAGDQEWRQQPLPFGPAGVIAKAELVPLGEELHLVWSTRDDHLGDGLIRHAVLRGRAWEELPPIAVGASDGFACFARGNGLDLIVVAADPLRSQPSQVVGKSWESGGWRDLRLSDAFEERLASATGLAAGNSGGRTFWLTTNFSGAYSWAGNAAQPASMLVQGMPSRFDWSRMTGLVTFVALAVLFILYCRRSRTVSRNFPAKPPDLVSRGAALGVDWLLVSFAMSLYHVASGDIYILADLIAFGDVQEMFWINLLGLSLFMAASEALFGVTPGKYLAGLRVRSVLGGRPSIVQATVRNLFRGIDMYPLGIAFPGLVGAIATLFGPRRQRIGDIFAATMVRRHAPLAERRFFLASASPRRLELMQALTANVRAEAMDVYEDSKPDEDPEDTVLRLAKAKVEAAAHNARNAEVVVAADTVVAIDGEILGKPKDAAEATGMLERLSGRSHSVFTGLMVWDSATGQAMSDVEETEVEFRTLSPREIADYVATGDPLDKAGAYGVQTGHLVKQVRGSLSNVAGLPMEKLQSLLATLDS